MSDLPTWDEIHRALNPNAPSRAELNELHKAWCAASGHPKGWRVVRGYSPLTELKNHRGRLILFKTREAAQRRAETLNRSNPTC